MRTARFEPWEVSAAGSAIFAVVYDTDGNCVFVERGAEPGDGPGEPLCAAISGSSDGAIWMSGAFRERFALHDREITAEGAGIFLARLAPDDDS